MHSVVGSTEMFHCVSSCEFVHMYIQSINARNYVGLHLYISQFFSGKTVPSVQLTPKFCDVSLQIVLFLLLLELEFKALKLRLIYAYFVSSVLQSIKILFVAIQS